MTSAVVLRGAIFDGVGGGVAGVLVPPLPTSYGPGSTITTLSDDDVARLIAAGILVDPNFQIVLFDGGPGEQVVPSS